LTIVLILLLSFSAWSNELCHYSYTVWNANRRTSEGPFRIQKLKYDLTKNERDISGCSVCEEDQEDITLSNSVRFRACRKVSMKMRAALEKILKEGRSIKTVVGYRPSISKGIIDREGRRTEFSRHAYGVAIDINEEFNGLYDQCINWGPSCRLIKGGKYSTSYPLSITRNSAEVRHFREEGFLWGGEIQGFQKDFMHFSPDGL
jgi:hypothetical protein